MTPTACGLESGGISSAGEAVNKKQKANRRARTLMRIRPRERPNDLKKTLQLNVFVSGGVDSDRTLDLRGALQELKSGAGLCIGLSTSINKHRVYDFFSKGSASSRTSVGGRTSASCHFFVGEFLISQLVPRTVLSNPCGVRRSSGPERPQDFLEPTFFT